MSSKIERLKKKRAALAPTLRDTTIVSPPIIKPPLVDEPNTTAPNISKEQETSLEHKYSHNFSPIALEELSKRRVAIVELIGEGGLGEVYRGVRVINIGSSEIHQDVAIKRSKVPEGVDVTLVKEMFEREIKALVDLDSPYIVKYIDHFYIEGTNEFVYIMEYVHGPTLDDLIYQKGKLSWDEVVPIIRQLCSAVITAHKKGIVHRDIKPSNIMLCDGMVKLLDFGVATVVEEGQSKTTKIVGTREYMAPEQLHGKASHKSDVWAIGTTAAHLLLGEDAFEKFLDGEDLKALDPNLPEAAIYVISRSRAFFPKDRISLEEFVSYFKPISELTSTQVLPKKKTRLLPYILASSLVGGALTVGYLFLPKNEPIEIDTLGASPSVSVPIQDDKKPRAPVVEILKPDLPVGEEVPSVSVLVKLNVPKAEVYLDGELFTEVLDGEELDLSTIDLPAELTFRAPGYKPKSIVLEDVESTERLFVSLKAESPDRTKTRRSSRRRSSKKKEEKGERSGFFLSTGD